MKKLLLILLYTTCGQTLFAQTDTIFTKNGKTIVCTITFVTQTALYYQIKGKDLDEMDLTKVSRFTQKPTKENQQTVIQTAQPFGQSKLPIDTATRKVVFRTVITLDTTYKADQIFSIVKEWFSTNTKNFNRSNSDKNFQTSDVLLGVERGNSANIDQLYKNDQPLKLQDPAEKKLIGKGVLKFTGTSFGCIRILYIEYDIKVFVKDAKLKVEITNLNYTHYNQMSMKQCQIAGFSDNGPTCNSKNTIESLLQCDHCEDGLNEFYSYLRTDMNNLTLDLKKYIKDNKKTSAGDGW